jgi:hypothetical protein
VISHSEASEAPIEFPECINQPIDLPVEVQSILMAYAMFTDAIHLSSEEVDKLMQLQIRMLTFVRKTLSTVCSEDELQKILTKSMEIRMMYKSYIMEKYGSLLELNCLYMSPEDTLQVQTAVEVCNNCSFGDYIGNSITTL